MAQRRFDLKPLDEEEEKKFDLVPLEEESISEPESEVETSFWDKINTPLTDLPSRATRGVGTPFFQGLREKMSNPFAASVIGFAEGANEKLGDLFTDATTPLNIGLEAITGGLASKFRGARKGLQAIRGQSKPVTNILEDVSETTKIPNSNEVIDSTDMRKGTIFEALEEGRKSQPKISLPRDLAGAKPRFYMGSKGYNPVFENDIDKAMYIVAQTNPSKRNADYLKFLVEATGLDETEILTIARRNKAMIKSMIQGSEPGDIQIPKLFDYLTEGRPSKISTPNVSASATASAKPRMKINGDGTFSPVDQPHLIYNNKGELLTRTAGGGKPPNAPDLDIPDKPRLPKQTIVGEIYDAARGSLSVDLPFITSAAFRQAAPHVGTKNWFKAWIPQAKAFSSKLAAKAHLDNIKSRPHFSPRKIKLPDGTIKTEKSIADEAGLRFSDFENYSEREEAIRTGLAEKIPGFGQWVKASNRSYGAFLNDLRANAFEDLYKNAKKLSEATRKIAKNQKEIDEAYYLDPDNNLMLRKEIAEFVNNSTGTGSLNFGKIPGTDGSELNLEKAAPYLSKLMFSARNTASRIQMVNPRNYTRQNPEVRKAYLQGLARAGGFWGTTAYMSSFLPDVDVSLNPTSSDFGKIKIGNTRLDPGAGFQQFLVAGARQTLGGSTSSVNPERGFQQFGEGFKANTRASAAEDFWKNKLHPTARLIFDLMNSSQDRPVDLTERTMQTYIPIILQDLAELIQEDPELIPLLIPMSAGIGGQTYDKEFNKPKVTPLIENFADILGLEGFEVPSMKLEGGSPIDPAKMRRYLPR